MDHKQPAIQLIGNDNDLSYLLGRFAEQSQHTVTLASEIASAQEIANTNPTAIIFLSMELLEEAQSFVAGLTRLEVPIIVCSSVTEEARARELGADSCLLHPITFHGFQDALAVANTSKRA